VKAIPFYAGPNESSRLPEFLMGKPKLFESMPIGEELVDFLQ